MRHATKLVFTDATSNMEEHNFSFHYLYSQYSRYGHYILYLQQSDADSQTFFTLVFIETGGFTNKHAFGMIR